VNVTTKESLSVEGMIGALRRQYDHHRSEISLAMINLDTWEQVAATAVGYERRTAITYTEHCRKVLAEREPIAAALEQAIACLTVLNHPGFRGIGRCGHAPYGKGVLEPFTVEVAEKPHDVFADEWSATHPIGALLKAHESLYPSTPLPDIPEKGKDHE